VTQKCNPPSIRARAIPVLATLPAYLGVTAMTIIKNNWFINNIIAVINL